MCTINRVNQHIMATNTSEHKNLTWFTPTGLHPQWLASYIIHSYSVLTIGAHCAHIRYISSTQNSLVIHAYSAHLAHFSSSLSSSTLTELHSSLLSSQLFKIYSTNFYPQNPLHIYTLILGLSPLQNGPKGLTTSN
jgi:hypothetical protein